MIGVDYGLVLRIINTDDDPPAALRSFVMQEREAALDRAGVVVVPHEMYIRLTAPDELDDRA